jgi:hypothetical protein
MAKKRTANKLFVARPKKRMTKILFDVCFLHRTRKYFSSPSTFRANEAQPLFLKKNFAMRFISNARQIHVFVVCFS